MKRHAFLLLVHDNPEQVIRLCRALRHDAFDLFVHVDRKADWSAFKNLPVKHVSTVYDIRWGGFRMIEATLHLLRMAAQEGYATYTLLSGSDYPVRPAEEIREVLDATTASRIDYWHDEDVSWHRRYHRLFFNDWGAPGRIFNAISRRLWRILPPIPFPKGITPYFGSQWWTLTHEGARAAISFADTNPAFMRRLRFVHIPDETFFQTALVHSGTPLLREPLRYLDWSERRANPKLLSFEDLDAIGRSGALLARKFDERTNQGVLDVLDEMRAMKIVQYHRDSHQAYALDNN